MKFYKVSIRRLINHALLRTESGKSITEPAAPAPATASSGGALGVNKMTEEEQVPLFEIPQGDKFELFKWAVCLPLHVACHYTMPNCRLQKWRNWYLISFFISMLWISFFSYVMVWMITIIGKFSLDALHFHLFRFII